ncbi:MAG: hypothetical protein JST86_08260 [Bacteroidetes bacterium]|nr:hypothetical protein [Bacteroidota bacterium]
MKLIIAFLLSMFLLYSCTQPDAAATATVAVAVKAKNPIDHHWLDSVIKNHADSIYSKPYKRTDFVTATWYVNKKDTSVCQVMRDSADTVRQVIIAKKGVRTFFAQYFDNGQLQASLPLDAFGQYHGQAAYYYKDGTVENSGHYLHGLKNGLWQNFDEKGKLISTDAYNQDGQAIKTTKNPG